MPKKLEGNGLWESSRMILPEHRVRMQEQRQQLKRRDRIELDEQELEQMQERLAESLQHGSAVKVRVYHPYEEQLVTGRVDRVHAQRQRILVDGYWIDMRDIESVEPC
ncbi:YolD-like family protein [Paenibacillus daejeonensis]|uniref:YolD-like family protein n=1 Tax=Paenibacillus daejeonensis TaxID=135193 RepID=UPI000381DD25|nr:YolD-like family protein [Paenibacillus daejeonensis]